MNTANNNYNKQAVDTQTVISSVKHFQKFLQNDTL